MQSTPIMVRLRAKSLRLIMVAFLMAFVILIFYYQNVSIRHLSLSEWAKVVSAPTDDENPREIYTIVIDAGSTGSRIHVFRIYHDNSESSSSSSLQSSSIQRRKFDAKLVSEDLFIKVKPGLSSYSSAPDEATNSIKPLLDKALDVIPKTKHTLTRLTLKATAGLRLISEQVADRILNNIRNLFKSYPFKTKHEDTSILDGKYEGIYSWITLNYALNTFDKAFESRVCALDLGGGSTQLTFIPNESATLRTVGNEYLVNFRVDEADFNIYSKSFLGFGIMSARMSIFRVDVLNQLMPSRAKKSDKHLFSYCLPGGHAGTWLQQGVEYSVNGPESTEPDQFANCLQSVTAAVSNKLNAPAELRNKDIYAFSYFYDVLKSSGIFGASGSNEGGGALLMADVKNKTIEICEASNKRRQLISKNDNTYDSFDPFLCMDLAYIYILMSNGYGLPDDKTVNFHNKVNNMEISWALGAAFHISLND